MSNDEIKPRVYLPAPGDTKKKKGPPGSARAVHFLRLHKVLTTDDNTGCVGWSDTLRLPVGYTKPHALWSIPDHKRNDPKPYLEPVVRWNGRLVEAWRVEWYRMTGYMPRPWEGLETYCGNPVCLKFDHYKGLVKREIPAGDKFRALLSPKLTDDPLGPAYYRTWSAEGPDHILWLGQFTSPKTVVRQLSDGSTRTYVSGRYPVFYHKGRTISVRTFLYRKVMKIREIPLQFDEDKAGMKYSALRELTELGEEWDPIPPGYIPILTCGEPRCVNVDHMTLVRRGADNVAKIIGGSRPRATHCRSGHEFTPNNTYWTKAGTRLCKECTRARQERYRGEGRLNLPDEVLPPEMVEGDRAFAVMQFDPQSIVDGTTFDELQAKLLAEMQFDPLAGIIHEEKKEATRRELKRNGGNGTVGKRSKWSDYEEEEDGE